MYKIRRVRSEEVSQALTLASEVFMEFEAPDYTTEGVQTFRRDIVENHTFINKCKQGLCPLYAALDGDTIIGIMGMRESKKHINLAFVRKEYHRKGVAASIFRYLLEDIRKENPEIKEITLNSSPYGKPFYLHIGFIPQSAEQEIDGIRFTPMKYILSE